MNVKFTDLIKENVIIDISLFELVESITLRKIFVNIFIHYLLNALRSENKSIREEGDISNFVIIEEIQKIAPLIYLGKNQINSFIGLAPWTVRAYGVCLGFIGTDVDVETPILTNTGISIFFYSKHNLDKIANTLGIQIHELMKYLNEVKKRRTFLISIKGEIKIIQAFEFKINNKSDNLRSN